MENKQTTSDAVAVGVIKAVLVLAFLGAALAFVGCQWYASMHPEQPTWESGWQPYD